MSLKVTFTRDSLSLPDLVIDDNPYAGDYHLGEDGNQYPRFPVVRDYAPDSVFRNGRLLLGWRLDEGTLRLRIYAHGDDAAGVKAARAALDATTLQTEYTVTLEVDGVVEGSWVACPEVGDWGDIESGLVKACMAVATVTIPLHPGDVSEES